MDIMLALGSYLLCIIVTIGIVSSSSLVRCDKLIAFAIVFLISIETVGWVSMRYIPNGTIISAIISFVIIFLCFLLGHVKLNRFVLNWSSPVVIFFLLVTSIGVLVGSFNQNHLRYIMSDTYNLYYILALAILLIHFAKKNGLVRTLTIISYCYMVADLLLFGERLITGQRLGGPNLFPMIWAVVSLADTRVEKAGGIPHQWAYIVLYAIAIIAIVSGSRKSTVEVFMLFILLMPILLGILRKRLVQSIFIMFVVIVAAVSSGAVTQGVEDTMAKFQGTISDGEVVDQSAYERIMEASLTIGNVITSNNAFVYLFGFGSGSTYYSQVAAEGGPGYVLYKHSNFYIHNVHNTFAAVVFRYGFVGLIVFLFCIIFLLRQIAPKKSNFYFNVQARKVIFYYFAIYLFIDTYLIYTLADHVLWSMCIVFSVMLLEEKHLIKCQRRILNVYYNVFSKVINK